MGKGEEKGKRGREKAKKGRLNGKTIEEKGCMGKIGEEKGINRDQW